MKTLATITLILTFAASGMTVSTTQAKPPKLSAPKAASIAYTAMNRFATRYNYNLYATTKITTCLRRSRAQISCRGSAQGENETSVFRCDMTTVVTRNPRSFVYWLTRKRCRATAKPYLTDQQARSAMQSKADQVAGRPATLEAIYRLSNTEFRGSASWTQAGGIRGTELCSIRLTATLSSGYVAVSSTTPDCF